MDAGSNESNAKAPVHGTELGDISNDPKPKFCMGCVFEDRVIGVGSPCWSCRGEGYTMQLRRDWEEIVRG